MWLTTCRIKSQILSKMGSINSFFSYHRIKYLVHWELNLSQHYIIHKNSFLSGSNFMQEITYDLIYHRLRNIWVKNISCLKVSLYLIFVADDPSSIHLYGQMNKSSFNLHGSR
jgi:hypothetical protein